MALLTRLLESNTRHWGHAITDALVTLVNDGVRTPGGHTLVRPLIASTQAGALDVWQVLAEDMAVNETTVDYSADYTISLRTPYDRAWATELYSCTEIRFTLPLNGDGFQRLDDASMITAAQIYAAISGSGVFAVYPTIDEVYLAVGYGEVPYTDLDPTPQTMYLSVYMLDGSLGIQGYGLKIRPSQAFTPAPVDHQYLQANAILWGETWHEEFLSYVNEQRAFYGLPEYRLPTALVYTAYPDIAQMHSLNIKNARVWAHADVAYPDGQRTFGDRAAILGKLGGENLLRAPLTGVLDPFVNQESGLSYPLSMFDESRQIIQDSTILTPYQAFSGWWNSAGHRQNMLRDWGSDIIYSFLGFEIGLYATTPVDPTLVSPNQEIFIANVFAVLEAEVLERTLFVDYQITGAMILVQDLTFRLDAMVKVRAEHSAAYAIRIGVPHQGDYGCRVAVQHVAPIHYGVQADFSAVYTGTVQLIADHQAEYRITDKVPVREQHESPWAIRFGKAHNAEYSTPAKVQQAHKAGYEPILPVRRAHQASYSEGYPIKAKHVGSYTINSSIKAENKAKFDLLTYVRADHSAAYDVRTLNPVQASNRSLYAMLTSNTQVIQATASLTLATGRQILITDAVVSADEDSYAWQASIRIPDLDAYVLITEGDLLTLTIGGESYAMLVTSRSLSRDGPASMDMRIACMSPTVTLDSPRAQPIDLSIDTAMMAKDIVELALGRAVNWEMVNWQIPPYRVQFTQSTPMEIARAIVASAGGIIQTERDGQVTARPLFPVTLSQAQLVAADQTLNDAEDLLDVGEEYEYHSGSSQFRIREGETTFGDRLDWVPAEGSTIQGVLRVLPSPWRTAFTIDCTDSPNVTIFKSDGEVFRQEQELVEFRQGVGGVNYPIHSLDNVEWLSDGLGAPVFSQYSTSLQGSVLVNEGYGLAQITYTTRAIEYQVTGANAEPIVQFVMKEGA